MSIISSCFYYNNLYVRRKTKRVKNRKQDDLREARAGTQLQSIYDNALEKMRVRANGKHYPQRGNFV